MNRGSFSAIASVAYKEFLHIYRDRRVLILLLILPPVFTLVFGHAFEAGEMTNVPALRVLEANLDFSYSVRPCWWVAATGLGLAALNLGLRLSGKHEPARRVRATPAEQVRPVEAA